MKLVQKLPIGLSLACLMFMSSCSKEDAQMPEPKVEQINTSSNLKEGQALVLVNTAYMPSTAGSTGLDAYPENWERNTGSFFSTDMAKFPTGTSNLDYIWGDVTNHWHLPFETTPLGKPLSSVPRGAGSIITVTTAAPSWQSGPGKCSSVKTKIKYLIPGKTYKVTFYVTTTIPSNPPQWYNYYAKSAEIGLAFVKPGGSSSYNYSVDLADGHSKWIAKTITFKAESSEAEFSFTAYTLSGGEKYSYAHIYVDKDAIKKMN